MEIKQLNAEIGYRLSHFRKSNRFTQIKFAELLNTSQGRISLVEKGVLDIDPAWIYFLTKKFKLNPMFIFGFSKNLYLTELKDGYILGSKIPFIESPMAEVKGIGDEE